MPRKSQWRDLALVLVTQVPMFFSAFNPVDGDTDYYRSVAADVVAGLLPYRDRTVDYPPYALVPMLLPALVTVAMPAYRYLFALLVMLCDAALKWLLLCVGRQWQRSQAPRRPWLAYVPFVAYSADVILQDYIYCKRFDVVPALLVASCLVLASRSRWGWAGVLLSVAVGTKLYPILLGPLLLVIAWRAQRAKSFLLGIAMGAAPLLASSWLWPWWRFAVMQGGRGLQVESWAASVLWLAHFAGADAQWAQIHGNYFDIVGPLAAACLPVVKLLWLAITVGTCAWVTWRVRDGEMPLPRIALASLCVLLAFVTFSNVLSPQYMVWLVPLAGLAALQGDWRWWMAPFAVATAVTFLSYPAPHYGTTGLGLSRTLVLVARNACLGWSWWKLVRVV